MSRLPEPNDFTTHRFRIGTPEEALKIHSRGDFVDHPEKYDQDAIIDDYISAVEDHVRHSVIDAATGRWDNDFRRAYITQNVEVWWDHSGLVAEVPDDLELSDHVLEEAWLRATEPAPEGGIDFAEIADRHELESDAELIAQLVREGFPQKAGAQVGVSSTGGQLTPRSQQLTHDPLTPDNSTLVGARRERPADAQSQGGRTA